MRQLLDWPREAADPGEFPGGRLRYRTLAVQRDLRVHAERAILITSRRARPPVDFRIRGAHRGRPSAASAPGVNGRLVALERKLEKRPKWSRFFTS